MSNISHNELLEKGKCAYDSGNYLKAQKYLEELMEIDRDCIDAIFYLANIFHMQGELGKAIKAFSRVLSLDRTHTDAAISLSILYNDIGRYEDAKAIFDRANQRVKSVGKQVTDIHINKKFAMKHLELADLYMTYNRFDDALFEYNKAIALDAENLEARIKVAKVYAKKGFMAKAIDELKKLRNEQPSFHPARVALGVLHYGNGNVLEAQTEWNKVLSMDPLHQEAKMYINLSKTATETVL